MLKLSKKLLALILVAMLALTSMVGCTKEPKEFDENAVVMTIGDAEITMGMMNFYVRYQQSLVESVYQSYMGDTVWRQEVEEGTTYEESMKKSILEQFQEMYLIYAHAEDYKVTLTEAEQTNIADVAAKFAKANSDDAKKKASANEKYALEYLKMLLISNKMEDAMKADIDTDLTGVDKTQKRMRYVAYEFEKTVNGETTKYEGDDRKELKKEAEALLKEAKANGSLETYCKEKEVESFTLTFDAETTGLDEKVIKAADALKANEFAELLEAEDGYYVVQLESEFDSDATDAALEKELEERGQKRYDELVKKWKDETKIKVDKELWAKISLDDLKINSIVPETEKTDDKKEDTAEDTTTEETTDTTTDATTDATDEK